MTANLDAQFGHCITPVRTNAAEGNHCPLTLFTLNAETAPRIALFITMSLDEHHFSCFPFSDFAILWVVNETGDILIAIEEGIIGEGGASVMFPLPKQLGPKLPQMPGFSKLGHPALVNCRPARIAGEISCDLDEDPRRWYINNRSGRYGVNLGRTPQHLANVVAAFSQFGIQLQPDFFA